MGYGGGGGGSGYTTSTTSNDPWQGQAPYLRDLFRSGWEGMTGYDTSGNKINPANPADPSFNFIKMFTGEDAPGKLEYAGDPEGLWGGTGLNAISGGTSKGLGTSTLGMTAAPTIAAFTPEELAAQNIIKNRLQGRTTYQDPSGYTYSTGANALIPIAKTALGNIVSGANRINPASFTAASAAAPSTISRPAIDIPNSFQTPSMDSTNLGYRYWNELGDVAGNKSNPYFEDMISNATRNLRNEHFNYEVPSLDTTAELAGRYGGDRWAKLRTDAYDKYLQNVGEVENTMRGKAFESNMGRALEAMNLGGNLATSQASFDADRAARQAGMEMERRAKEYDTSAAAKQLTGQLGLQAETAQAGNELTRGIQNALLEQEAAREGAGFTQQANVQNVANILTGAPIAPGVSQSDYEDIAKLAAVGESQGAKQQDIIDAFVQRFETNQLEPMVRMANISNLLSGNFGGTTTSRAPATSSGGYF